MKRILQLAIVLLSCNFADAQMTYGSLTGSHGFIGFLYYTPPNYRPTGTGHPLIISLSGQGEEGDGSPGQIGGLYIGGIPLKIKNGANMVFTYNGYTDGFVVIAPQLQVGGSWQNYHVDDILAYAISHFNVDQSRIILTGYSLGGVGTLDYAFTSPNLNKFAAIVPISCAANPGSTNYCNVATSQVGMWAFQGGQDGTFGGTTQHAYVTTINACSGLVVPAMDTIYANEVHGANFWDIKVYDVGNTYHYPNTFQWMLMASRPLTQNLATNQNPVPVIGAGSVLNYTTPVKYSELPLLDGSTSHDDDIIVDYYWAEDGPANSALSSTLWPTTQLVTTNYQIAPQQGTYNIHLRVKDWFTSKPGHTQTADLTININLPPSGHSAPAVNAGGSRSISTSTDSQIPDFFFYSCSGCGPANYNWTMVSWPAGASPSLRDYNTPANPYVPGNYVVRFAGMTVNGDYKFRFTAGNQAGDQQSDVLTLTRTGALLPVTYSFINAVNSGSKNIISWATSAEVNSDRFDVQRSADGINFSTIGSVRASGTSSGTINYSFDDNNPLQGMAYYRLSQVDKDGKVNLSKTVSVTTRVSGLIVNTYPNPVHDNITLAIQSPANGRVQIVIADMQGKTLIRQEWQKEGVASSKQVNLSSLQAGVYQLVITVGAEKHISSLVKY